MATTIKRSTGRAKPLVPSAGPTGRRYGTGGKIKKSKPKTK